MTEAQFISCSRSLAVTASFLLLGLVVSGTVQAQQPLPESGPVGKPIQPARAAGRRGHHYPGSGPSVITRALW